MHKGLETQAAWDTQGRQNDQVQKLVSTSVATLLFTFLGQVQTLTTTPSPQFQSLNYREHKQCRRPEF